MDSLFGLDKVSSHNEDVELLVTTHDNVELSILRSILEGENIPYRMRERGSGGMVKVIAGYSMMGTDIFVPKDILPQALELLDAYRNGEVVEDDADGREEE